MRASRLVWLPVAMMCVALSARASVFATVVLTPNNGLPGETIQVDGSDWLTDDTKTIDFVEVELNVGSALPTLGAFSTTFEVPSITPGVYTVRVSDGTEFTDATFTVDETAADPLVIIIESDADGDGAVDSTVSPYSVLEISSPAPYLVISVSGGGGAEYSLEFSNLPALGSLVDPTTTSQLVEGSILSTTGGAVVVEFIGAPQSTASFSDSDSFKCARTMQRVIARR